MRKKDLELRLPHGLPRSARDECPPAGIGLDEPFSRRLYRFRTAVRLTPKRCARSRSAAIGPQAGVGPSQSTPRPLDDLLKQSRGSDRSINGLWIYRSMSTFPISHLVKTLAMRSYHYTIWSTAARKWLRSASVHA